MSFLKKALSSGITPANILSWLLIQNTRLCGGFFSTLALYLKARLLGVEIGKNVRANGKILLLRWPGATISIGSNVSLVSSSKRATATAISFPIRLRVFGKAKIIIGDNCELSGVSITARSTAVVLGKNVLLAPGVIIVDSDFHAHWPAQTRHLLPGTENDAQVIIGDHVWIGLNSIILKGVTIGSGAIIGAGSVVTGDIPENCVACGNPAKVIRYYENR